MPRTKIEVKPEEIAVKRWINEHEAAFYMGIALRSVRNLRRLGSNKGIKLPASKVNGIVLIDKRDIDKFIQKHQIKSQVI